MVHLIGGIAFLVLQARSADFKLYSDDLKNGRFVQANILNGFGCTGGNVSPDLAWENAPQGAKSFVVTMYDPDAKTGSGWWHWVIANIPSTTKALPSGVNKDAAKLPRGSIETRTDFGPPGYGGPCPPAGDPAHRYVFAIYALKIDKLPVDAQTSAAMVGFLTNASSVGKATLSVNYGRR
jgi:Raf kinase inhibitor-like YbhB/YbcL family protein